MPQALVIAQLIESLLPTLAGLVTQAILAARSNDQATLDALLKQAEAAADALKPTA